ncbi:hypothetical protein [Actinophytocola sp.]|uniref:hypothetical protein n=1 Tax=Actinophytocola sp. TaxID=1872138 RepID=UPI002D80FE13|nr:hypothetical protein [Actinophytocola sp.]HET9139505.1 hypothetical protein [Actinophytocola sp.]
MSQVQLGPLGIWVGAAATFVIALVTVFVALGWFERFRAARFTITFEHRQPWCRPASPGSAELLWVRIGVENRGRQTARGCVGRLIAVTTEGAPRQDIDPVQLRWAGVPRSRAFDPLDLRRDQREFLNVLVLAKDSRWRIVTFDAPDFDPGFTTELTAGQEHVLEVAIYCDNTDTDTVACRLSIDAAGHPHEPRLTFTASPS